MRLIKLNKEQKKRYIQNLAACQGLIEERCSEDELDMLAGYLKGIIDGDSENLFILEQTDPAIILLMRVCAQIAMIDNSALKPVTALSEAYCDSYSCDGGEERCI